MAKYLSYWYSVYYITRNYIIANTGYSVKVVYVRGRQLFFARSAPCVPVGARADHSARRPEAVEKMWPPSAHKREGPAAKRWEGSCAAGRFSAPQDASRPARLPLYPLSAHIPRCLLPAPVPGASSVLRPRRRPETWRLPTKNHNMGPAAGPDAPVCLKTHGLIRHFG